MGPQERLLRHLFKILCALGVLIYGLYSVFSDKTSVFRVDVAYSLLIGGLFAALVIYNYYQKHRRPQPQKQVKANDTENAEL